MSDLREGDRVRVTRAGETYDGMTGTIRLPGKFQMRGELTVGLDGDDHQNYYFTRDELERIVDVGGGIEHPPEDALDVENVPIGEAAAWAMGFPGDPDEVAVTLDDDLGEIRVTDATTGGQKGQKLFRFALIPWEAARALARHYGIGAFKYDDDNWRKGYAWSLSADALERHFNAWKSGESTTVERFEKDGVRYAFETHHLIAVAWQAFTLYCFERWGVGSDDVRSKRIGVEDQTDVR